PGLCEVIGDESNDIRLVIDDEDALARCGRHGGGHCDMSSARNRSRSVATIISTARTLSVACGTIRSAWRLDGSTNSRCMGRTVVSYCSRISSTGRPRSRKLAEIVCE